MIITSEPLYIQEFDWNGFQSDDPEEDDYIPPDRQWVARAVADDILIDYAPNRKALELRYPGILPNHPDNDE